MFEIGAKELKAIEKVMTSGKMFRYHEGGQCNRFEQRYAEHLGAKFVCMTSSGTTALTAALAAMKIGPGDEVIVPAHTYMATAIAVLAVGAIPVICDIDETITLDPKAFDALVGPRTRAVIPVHMWGLNCDMDAIRKVARKHKLVVIEDACQAVGGEYKGKKLGAIGDAGAFSFNFFKNMTCGEGGAVVVKTNDERRIVQCMVDCCGFFWTGSEDGKVKPFAANGSRASEFEGAIMNVQLDRLPRIIKTLRRNKARLIKAIGAKTGLTFNRVNDPDGECATGLMVMLPTADAAEAFAGKTGGTVCARTGRHTYTEWTPVLEKRGAHHPAMDPYKMPANKGCRMEYSIDMLPVSMDILSRTVRLGVGLRDDAAAIKAKAAKVRDAAAEVLAD